MQQVEDEVRRIAETLPDGAATPIEEPGDTPGGKSLILEPRNPAAARVHVYVADAEDVTWITVGRGAIFEIPLEGHRYSDLQHLDEIRAVILAAVRGDVKETVLLKGGEVVGGSARATIGSKEVGDTWRQPTNPLRRPKKRSFVYEPYA